MPPAERSVDVLLVGGGVASMRCARGLRRHGFDGSILLVGDEERPPYNRPPLSKELLRDDLEALSRRTGTSIFTSLSSRSSRDTTTKAIC